MPLPGSCAASTPPHARHRLAMLGVLDEPVAGQLVSLLPHLAAALAVALAGDAAVAARGLADLAQRQHQIRERQHRVDALRLLLRAAARQQHAALRREQPHRAQLLLDRDAGEPLDVRGMHLEHGAPHVIEPDRAPRNVVGVDEPLLDRQVQKAVRERQVRPRRQRQVHIGDARRLGATRIDDDQLAGGALLVHPLHDRRHGLGRVRAPQQQRLRARDVADRKRQPAVDPEGLVLASRRRRHAIAPVVVDVGRAQRHAHELAQQVGLLVGERAATERRQRRRAVRLAQADQLLGDEVERRLPGHRREAPGARAHQRRREARGVIQEVARGEPLDAHLPAIDRKLWVGPDVGARRGDRIGSRHRRDRHAALKRAVGAVRPGGDGVDHPQDGRRERLGTCTDHG